MTTSSRMIFAFARFVSHYVEVYQWKKSHEYRDGGLPLSYYLSRIHPRLGLPLNGLMLTAAVVIAFGLIFLGSSRYFLHISGKYGC